MNVRTRPLRQNLPFHSVNPLKGNAFLSLRAIPFLIVLASGLAIQPAARAQVLTTITVEKPNKLGSIQGLITNPQQTTVYVADRLKNRVGVIDVSTNLLTGFISTKKSPDGLGISPDGSTLYVTEETSSLEAISISAGTSLFSKTVGLAPQVPGVSPDGSTVYVPAFDGTVTPVGGPVNKTINVGGQAVQAAFSPDGSLAYVSNTAGYISVINTATGGILATIGTPTPVIGLVVSGNLLFATGVNAVYVIDFTAGSTSIISVPKPANTLFGFPALTSDGGFLYIPANENPTTLGARAEVLVLDLSTGKLVGTPIVVGRRPIQIAIADIPGYVYVSNASSGTVSVISLF